MELRRSPKNLNLCSRLLVVVCALLSLLSAANLEAQAPRPRATPPPQDPFIQAQSSANAARMYSQALDLLVKAYLGSDQKAHAVPGTAAALLAVVQADPEGQYGAKARQMLNLPGWVWPDWDGQSGLETSSQPVADSGLAKAQNLVQQQVGTTEGAARNGLSSSDIAAMLDSAKSKSVKLSGDEKSKVANSKYFTSGPKWDQDHCNKNNYDEGSWDTSSACEALATGFLQVLGAGSHAAEMALQRACAFTVHHRYIAPCAELGELYVKRGDDATALAVYLHAPNCNQDFGNAEEHSACLRGAAAIYRKFGDVSHEGAIVQIVCTTYNLYDACARFNQLGGSVDLAVVKRKHNEDQAAERAANEARERGEADDRAERHRESEARFDAVMGTLQSMPGGSDPNAVVNAGNQQAAAIRPAGDANAAQQQAAAQQRIAAQKAAQQATSAGSSGAQSTATQTAGAELPITRPSAPLTVRFQTITGYQGNAHVVSNPPGIDCPGTCSFQFGQNVAVMLSATADQSSAVKSLSCQMSAGTGVLKAGNAMSCSIPQWAYAGPQVIVYVDSFPAPGITSSASNGTGANGSGSGGSSGENGNSSGTGGGNSSARADQYAAPLSNSCVRSFWDPQYYNWLSYENVCSQAIHIDYMFKDAKYGGAAGTTLAPGQHSNTGWSNDEINSHGPLLYFVCPANYLAVDSNTDKFVNQNTSGYRCKKQ